ncbi:MAG TPA: YceI family protein [Thermoanaerobaculia bacterium]|nr:YceI family protein [Thermoanaerobaculia bacterium]
MNRRLLSLSARITLAALALLLPLTAAAEPTTWNVDAVHSNVGFEVRHFLTQVPGRFGEYEGVIVYDPANPAASSVSFTVQTASIDTNNERRDGHLRSADFFDAEKFPTLSFQSKKVAALGENRLAVTGDFTMHGVTKEITVPVEVLGVMGDKAGFQTEFEVDRTEYGVLWNRNLDQGGTILGDDVKIRLSIEADRQKPEPEAEAQGG